MLERNRGRNRYVEKMVTKKSKFVDFENGGRTLLSNIEHEVCKNKVK